MRARSFRIRRSVAVAAAAVLAIGGVALLAGGIAEREGRLPTVSRI